MKILNKIWLVILALSMFCSACFVGCKSEEKEVVVPQDYYIVAQDQKTVNWAAQELSTFTKEMNGIEVPIYNEKPANATGYAIYLGTSDWAKEEFSSVDLKIDELESDGFAFIPVQDGLVVTSNYARGVSYGVYELLERNGVGFYASFEDGTYVPENDNVNYRITTAVVDNPDFDQRDIHNDTGYTPINDMSKKEMKELFLWLYRNRYNNYTIGYGIETHDLDDFVQTLGFSSKKGGHKFGFPDTNAHPEWQRVDKYGNKTSTGNFCVSKPEALMYVADQILSTCQANPNISSINMLAEDVYDGSWCYCDDCLIYSPNQQFNIVLQVVAEKIKDLYPNITIEYSLYHDTLDISEIDKCTMENVEGYFWPRERCVAHDLQDETCEKSVTYRNYLETMCNKFKKNTFCGYYGDLVLYNGIEVNANEQVAKDLKYAKELGIQNCANLMFSMMGTTQSDEMMMTFARCQWNVNADWESYVQGYYENLYGFDSQTAKNIMKLRYDYTEKLFSFCGYKEDYAIEGIIMGLDEQDFAKKHVLMMLEAENDINEIKSIYQSQKDKTLDERIIARLERKIAFTEMSRLRGLSVTHATKGAYLKRYIWDQDFVETFGECYQRAIDYHTQSMQYAVELGQEVFGCNWWLLSEGGLGPNITEFWKWKGEL